MHAKTPLALFCTLFALGGCTSDPTGAGGVCDVADLPQILSVIGNDSGDATRVRNGIIVTGALLATASFTLDDGSGPVTLGQTTNVTYWTEPNAPADNYTEIRFWLR